MPTKEDFEELEKHCKFKVVYKNIFAKLLKISSQIKGVKVISKTNMAIVFSYLPQASMVLFTTRKNRINEVKAAIIGPLHLI